MNILVTDKLPSEGIDILQSEGNYTVDVRIDLSNADLVKVIDGYDALIVRSRTRVTEDVIGAATNLKVIGRAGVGLDNVNVAAATKRGIVVLNAPGGNTISTAEHTISLLLALARSIPQANLSVKAGNWERARFIGTEIHGKKLGIIGLGRIGAEVAKRAQGLGMRVLGYDPLISSQKASKLNIELLSLDDVIGQADFITVHTPLTHETRHLLGAPQFAKMKDGICIINCARGGIIDEASLLDALKSGKVAGAALDVFENEPPGKNPLLELDSVVATPHLGASTKEAQVSVAVDVARQVIIALKGGPICSAVNVPSVEPEVFKQIQPYFELAEKMGRLQSQLVAGHAKEITVQVSGEIQMYDVSLITIAALKGYLGTFLQETINYVNARMLAEEKGIHIIESKTRRAKDYASLISINVVTDLESFSVAGTLFGRNDQRIVRINDYHIDAVPEGHMLFCFGNDQPGVIGSIGTLLAKENVNIAEMTFGRIKRGGQAVTVLNLDQAISEDVVYKITNLENVAEARLVKL